ncbi:unnamed protein product [Urochloa humidicola]
MEVKLSRGAVEAIWKDAAAVSAAGVPLVLQVRDSRPWRGAPEGWHHMLLSDGDHLINGGLSPGMAASSAARSMRKGAVVRFTKFQCVASAGKRLIVPKELQVLQTEWVTIGDPKRYQSTRMEGKHEELVESNTGTYSAGEGLNRLLTRGILVMLQKPVMQVVTVMISRQGNLEEIHLVLSDGVHTQIVSLASHLNYLVKNRHIQMGTIVRLLEFVCNTIQNPSMISVVQLEVLRTECELIGRPQAYELCCIGKPYELQIKCGEPYHGSVPSYAQPDNASYSSDQGLKCLLTEGAVVAILEGKMALEQKPVMQVVDVSVVCKGESSLYCVLLSDGVHQEHALLYSDTNILVERNWLHCGSIVRILKFNCDTSMNYRVLFVGLEVLLKECDLIGRPTFHELGLEHKELYANLAASVPVLPEQTDRTVPDPLEDMAKSTGQSHPGYKSTPD